MSSPKRTLTSDKWFEHEHRQPVITGAGQKTGYEIKINNKCTQII